MRAEASEDLMEFLKKIEENHGKFSKFNNIKYTRFQQLLPNATVCRIINMLPYLLCVNSRKLPGYVDGDVPLGVVNFTLDEDTRRFIRSKFTGAPIEENPEGDFVKMIAVMGSVGTVAYNKKSDLDYWVCIHRNTVNNEQYNLFCRKVVAIQEWASDELEVPVHLFVNDIEHVKKNLFAEDEEEAFGTTVGAVLKDEFFRSSILIAGKIPFWWVIPNYVTDGEYEQFYQKIPDDMKRSLYVDLGNLHEISREDFLGAALFQIIKSLGNPFKSIIKIGVLEKYLFGETDSPLLSQKVKMHMLQDQLDNTIVDSYLLMFEEVYKYYSSVLDDISMLDILKQNLYLKIDPQLSKYVGIKDKKNIPYKVAVMSRYVYSWKWDIKTIEDMDNFDNWEFRRVTSFWDSVKKFMLMSYQKISSQMVTLNLEEKISEADFKLLSRKIKTHFAVEDNKVEKLITFKDAPSEPILYVEPVSEGIRDVEWRLYKRNKSEKSVFRTITLNKENDLVRLLVWAVFNQIYDRQYTRINIQSGYIRVNPNLVVELLNPLSDFFTDERSVIKNEYLQRPAFTLLNAVIINFNNEDAEQVESIYHVYHTSWGEAYIMKYEEAPDIGTILHIILNDALHLKRTFDDYCLVNTPAPYKKYFKQLQGVFRESYNFIVRSDDKQAARFVTMLEGKIFIITKNRESVTVNVHDNLVKMLATLTLKPAAKIRYYFYGEEPVIKKLQAIVERCRGKAVTIAYEESGQQLILYIVNEKGNIFTFFKPAKMKRDFLVNIYGFCINTGKNITPFRAEEEIDSSSMQCFSLGVDRRGQVVIEDETNTIRGDYLANYSRSKSLRVQIAKHMSDETFYNIIFPDEISSGFMTMNEFYSVGQKMKDLVYSNIEFIPCIGEIFYTDLKDKEKQLGSTLYFVEKYRLEFIIASLLRK